MPALPMGRVEKAAATCGNGESVKIETARRREALAEAFVMVVEWASETNEALKSARLHYVLDSFVCVNIFRLTICMMTMGYIYSIILVNDHGAY